MSLTGVKTPFVQRVQTKAGLKLYFRRGAIRRPLNSPDGSQALYDEVAAILAELDRVEKAKTPTPGTVGGVLNAYNRSADFLGLARSTQSNYQRLIDEITEDAGDVLLADVTAAWIAEMKNAWATRGHRAANLRLQILINAFDPAILDKRIKEDPFHRLKKVRRPHDAVEPNPVWSDEEVQAVMDLALARKMPGLARAVALGRWGGFTRGTICKIPLHARTTGFDADGRAHAGLYWLTEKKQVLCDKPEDERFTAFMATTPNRALTIAYNRRGEPWRERQLNQALDRLIDNLAEAGKVRPNLTLHGLRHSRGVELALAGTSDSEIMSQLEHADSRTAQIYRRQAERRQLADSAQAKINESIRRRVARKAADAASDNLVSEAAGTACERKL